MVEIEGKGQVQTVLPSGEEVEWAARLDGAVRHSA